ncbi:putative WW domain-containing protein [Helianthus annuus]|nr:putative WW domain-containing protein [Helianthus annuus]
MLDVATTCVLLEEFDAYWLVFHNATSVPHPVSQHAYSPLGATSSNPNTASPPFRMPPGPPFQPPPGAPRTPVTPQQPFYGSYASNSPMARSLASIRNLSRPQLLPYPPAFPLSAQRTPLPLVQPSNAQPPSTSIGVSGSVAQVYNSKHLNAVGVKEESVAGDLLDAWSAHRTETGTIYYYNAVTGQSTYQKPIGFKGEVRLFCFDCSITLYLKMHGRWTMHFKIHLQLYIFYIFNSYLLVSYILTLLTF